MTFFSNQIEAAKQIVEQFKVGANYTILLAEMQSGKTDAFMLAGAELVREGIVDRFVVFSGNAEKALKEQAKNQIDFWRKYEDYLYELLGEGPETRNTKPGTRNPKKETRHPIPETLRCP